MEDAKKEKQDECLKEYPDYNHVPLLECAYCQAKSNCGKTACG